MSAVQYMVGVDPVRVIYEELVESLPKKTTVLVDDVAEVYRGAMVAGSPYRTGDMRKLHTIVETGQYSRYIFSDVLYFDSVVGGHKVNGPIYSDRQRRWWFWYLNEVLGGVYENKTNGYLAGNNYPARAYASSASSIQEKEQQFLNSLMG